MNNRNKNTLPINFSAACYRPKPGLGFPQRGPLQVTDLRNSPVINQQGLAKYVHISRA
jgi:hypothetical protein